MLQTHYAASYYLLKEKRICELILYVISFSILPLNNLSLKPISYRFFRLGLELDFKVLWSCRFGFKSVKLNFIQLIRFWYLFPSSGTGSDFRHSLLALQPALLENAIIFQCRKKMNYFKRRYPIVWFKQCPRISKGLSAEVSKTGNKRPLLNGSCFFPECINWL